MNVLFQLKKNNKKSFSSLFLIILLAIYFFLTISVALAGEHKNKKVTVYHFIPYIIKKSNLPILVELSKNQTGEAEKKLQVLEKQGKSGLQVSILQALLLENKQGSQKTLDQLTSKIEKNKKNWQPYAVRGFYLLEKKYYTSALADFKKAQSLSKQKQEIILVGLSFSNETMGRVKKASEYLRQLVKIQVKKPEYWYSLALLLIQRVQMQQEQAQKSQVNSMDLIQEAKRAAKTAYILNSKNELIYKLYYHILEILEQNKQKESHLQSIIKENPTQSWAKLQLVTLYIHQKKFDEAKKWLEQVKDKEGETFLVNLAYGELFQAQKQNKQAITWFEKAYKQQKTATKLNLSLALLYLQEHEVHKAIPILKLLAQHDVPFPFVYQALTKYYFSTGEYDKLEHILQSGLKLQPNSLWFLTYYSQLYEIKNQPKKAVELYYKIQKLHGQNDYILGRLGEYYNKEEKYTKALHYFNLIKESKEKWILQGKILSLVGLKEYKKAMQNLVYMTKNHTDLLWVHRIKTLILYRTNQLKQAKQEVTLTIQELKEHKNKQEIQFFSNLKALLLLRLQKKEEAHVVLEDLWKNQKVKSIFTGSQLALSLSKTDKKQATKMVKQLLDFYGPNLLLLVIQNEIQGTSAQLWGFKEKSLEHTYLLHLLSYSFELADKDRQALKKKKSIYLPFLQYIQSLLEVQLTSKRVDSFPKKEAKQAWLAYIGMFYWEQQGESSLSDHWLTTAIHQIEKHKQAQASDMWIQVSASYLYDKQAQHKKNESILLSFLKQNPNSTWAKLRLAYVYSQTQKQAKAEALYLDLLKQQSDNSVVLNNLAWLYVSEPLLYADKKQKAIKLAEKAVKLDPSLANIDTLARAYEWAGQHKQALEHIQEESQKSYEAQRFLRKLEKGIKQKINKK